MIAQEIDKSSNVLRVAHDWAKAISLRVGELIVTAGRVGRFDLPENVTVLPLRRTEGTSAKRAGLELATQLGKLSWSRNIDLIFAHMVPSYALMATVFAKPARIPVCLWYASHGVTNYLRIAHRLVDAVATASSDSYPLDGGNVVVLGHGVDSSRYAPAGIKGCTPVILVASRITPMKQIHLAIEALGHPKLREHPKNPILEVAGKPFREGDQKYMNYLHRRVAELGLVERVRFLGAIPGGAMPQTLARTHLAISLRETPSLDKNGLEALLAGVPVISNNPSYKSVLGQFSDDLYLEEDEPGLLATKLAHLLDHPERRMQIATSLRESVEAEHGLQNFADRLVSLFETLCRGAPPPKQASPES